ncbi:hypothetical protein [Streptomyces sp. NPDC087437]|uniref:hypothetical protein n=1 Tax=Streptomyces sp. NPDC087437 TaxID=3365789 RepID=UPI003801CB61
MSVGCAVLTGMALLAVTAPPVAAATARVRAAPTPVTQTFTFTGAPQTYTVPAGAVVTITADGAGGADNTGTVCGFTGTGGTAGRVITTLPPTTAPTTFTVNVGGTGGKGCNGTGAGGYNGGAPGGTSSQLTGQFRRGSGGGGTSSVSTGAGLLVVAGGGGAGGGTPFAGTTAGGSGGNGGTPDATAGTTGAFGVDGSPGSGGQGGSTTTTTGGADGAPGTATGGCTPAAGNPGISFTGSTVGTGGIGGNNTGGNCVAAGAGGGGGGGYFAGGGGGASAPGTSGFGRAGGGGGGGGSSFATPTSTGTSYALSTIGTANNNGQLVISYTLKPTLTITKRHTGKLTRGERGVYTLTVRNAGPGPADGTTVTVHDTLPRGLHARGISGPGWKCDRKTLTCTRGNTLPAGSSYPSITLKVEVSRNAPHHITNRATVSGGGDPTTHSATDRTSIRHEYHHTHRHKRHQSRK